MRIGYIISTFPALSETFVVNDIRGLGQLGHEVTAIALKGPDPATHANPNYAIRGPIVRVRGLGMPLWRKLEKLAARRRLIRRRGAEFVRLYSQKPAEVCDVLWCDRLTWDAALDQIDRLKLDFLYVHFAMRQLLLGYHASRLLGIPLGITLQAHDIFVNPMARFFPQTLGQCAFVVTVSRYNREEILRLAPNLDAERLHVLANGIDVAGFSPQYHAAHRPFRFAGTGRLVEIKGFHVLIEAAGLLAKHRKDFVVRIVGEGELRAALEQRIAELGIECQVELQGKKDATFLQKWLPQQDCFVLPCVIAKDGNRDGMPLALREGMACGLPAISTQLLGLHETVSPGTGYLVEAGNAAALAQQMEKMIEMSPDDYAAMCRAARAKAENEFSLLHEVTMLQTWMQQALEQKGKP